jgi:outer membrane autotransporter protein
MAAVLPLTWFSELHSVTQRLGDLRLENRPKGTFANWLRAHGEKVNFNDKTTGTPFAARHFTTEVGADYKLPAVQNDVHVGLFTGYGQSVRDHTPAGEGLNESVYLGFFQLHQFTNGWYFDTVLKADVFRNRFTANTNDNEVTSATYRSWAAGASLELGRYITLSNGWFLEPQVQGAFAILKDKSYKVGDNMLVEMTLCTVTRAKAGLLFGRAIAHTQGPINLYLKAHAGTQTTNGSQLDVTLSNGRKHTFNPTIKGRYYEAGAGLSWQWRKTTQFYFDYTATKAEYYKKPWSINLGARYAW